MAMGDRSHFHDFESQLQATPLFGAFTCFLLALEMRCSMLFGYLIIIILLARAHGRLDMQLLSALGKEEMPSALKWQRPPQPSSSAGGRSADTVSRATERHLMITAGAAAEEDGEVKKMRAHREEMAVRLIHQDYTRPSGHSPNHHRTIRCGPC
ncbi:uncharacterized protein LOC111257546 [Setaria italica]|nr:uncharacterized protein LOC111257546 [Setaria italica]